jgi:hypothetical protein
MRASSHEDGDRYRARLYARRWMVALKREIADRRA